jgi:rubrerythrin
MKTKEAPAKKKAMPVKKEEPQNWWKCSECGYILQAVSSPEACPSCKQKCAFTDVTCYTPECGGPGNIDPQLLRPKR